MGKYSIPFENAKEYDDYFVNQITELFGMYEMSVGHGSNFLINIGPDNRGLLPEADVKRILELGSRIKAGYSTPANFTPLESQGGFLLIGHWFRLIFKA